MMTTFTPKFLLTQLLMVCTLITVLAQQSSISGVVTSDDGEPMPGVTITIQGTASGTITGLDGQYSLTAEKGDVLIFSFLGFKTQNITLQNQTSLDVELEVDIQSLEEVIVVGYGTVNKSDLTGSVSSVDSDKITAFPVLSATQTLQGRAAGVQIQSNNGGQPGAGYSIKIRGGSSISASSNPLRVVDGFVGAEMPPPEDIASIEILKDASATAIYGSRGANGVIMVTTKKGKSGQIKVDFNSSYSVQEVSNRLDLLNGEEFADYMQEFGDYAFQGSNTDWQDEIYRSGIVSNNQISVSGGNEKTRFYVSGTYFDQKGVVVGSDYNRYSINGSVDSDISERVKIGTNFYGRRSTVNGIRTQEGTGGSGQAGVIGSAFRFNPDLGIYNDDGTFVTSFIGGGEVDNPFALADQFKRESVTDRFQTNNYAQFSIFDWLDFKSTVGLSINNSREGEFWPSTLIFGRGNNGAASISSGKQSNFLNENYFSVHKEFDQHKIGWVTGYSFQKTVSESWEASATGFISNSSSYWALSQGSEAGTPVSGLTQIITKSYYTRVNYSLLDRYKFTATARYDGSSNFAKNKKWAFFPSAAIAWNVKDEPFMQNVGLFDHLKVRASYGRSGNQAIGAYQSLASLKPTYSGRDGENAIAIENLANHDLTWETTAQTDIGLDMGFVKGRVNVSLDLYEKNTFDLLYERPVPSYLGILTNSSAPTLLQNTGEINNRGYELTINSKNMVGAFEWSTDLIISANRNKVMKLSDTLQTANVGVYPGHLLLSSDIQLLEVGKPLGVFYGYVYQGIYQNGDTFLGGESETQAGGEKYADLSGPEGVPDGVLDSYDRKIIGDPNPNFTWSLNNTFSYKNIDLNIFLMGVHGQDMLNFTLMELETLSGTSNTTKKALNRWTPEDPNTNVPSAVPGRGFKMSDKYVFDASYIRVKNIVLGYNIPDKVLDKVNIRRLRIYASAQNLFTITNYPGLDPEVAYRVSSAPNVNIGLDYASYPNVKSYTFGINLGF